MSAEELETDKIVKLAISDETQEVCYLTITANSKEIKNYPSVSIMSPIHSEGWMK